MSLDVSLEVTFSIQLRFPKRLQASVVAETVLWHTWCLYFGIPGDDFGSLGAPWGAKGAAEETLLGQESDSDLFWVDFGTPF